MSKQSEKQQEGPGHQSAVGRDKWWGGWHRIVAAEEDGDEGLKHLWLYWEQNKERSKASEQGFPGAWGRLLWVVTRVSKKREAGKRKSREYFVFFFWGREVSCDERWNINNESLNWGGGLGKKAVISEAVVTQSTELSNTSRTLVQAETAQEPLL